MTGVPEVSLRLGDQQLLPLLVEHFRLLLVLLRLLLLPSDWRLPAAAWLDRGEKTSASRWARVLRAKVCDGLGWLEETSLSILERSVPEITARRDARTELCK